MKEVTEAVRGATGKVSRNTIMHALEAMGEILFLFTMEIHGIILFKRVRSPIYVSKSTV